MADPKKNPLIGAFRAPVPSAPPDTSAPPGTEKPSAAGATKPIDEKKGPEAAQGSGRSPLPSPPMGRRSRRPPSPPQTPPPSLPIGRRSRRSPRPLRTPPPSLPTGKPLRRKRNPPVNLIPQNPRVMVSTSYHKFLWMKSWRTAFLWQRKMTPLSRC